MSRFFLKSYVLLRKLVKQKKITLVNSKKGLNEGLKEICIQ